MALPLLILVFFLTVNIIFPYPPPTKVGASGRGKVEDFPRPPDRDASRCTLDYIKTIRDAVKAKDPPQLSFDQILWIYTVVQTSSSAVTSTSASPHNFLVWGLGYDSPIWDNANCIPAGTGDIDIEGSLQSGDEAHVRSGKVPRAGGVTRTVFIENWLDWVEKIKGKYPTLNVVHFDKYQTSVATASEFFARPYLLPLPEEVDDVCWHVVLVGESQFISFVRYVDITILKRDSRRSTGICSCSPRTACGGLLVCLHGKEVLAGRSARRRVHISARRQQAARERGRREDPEG
jgi:hypothetical protein